MKASLPKLLNSFVRHTAVRFTSRRSVSKIGNQGMSPRDEIFVRWSFDESVRYAHGFSLVLRGKDSKRRRLLRCGISFRPMSAAGQTPVIRRCRLNVRFARKRTWLADL